MIWYILESKNAALVAAVFIDFPKNKMCKFMSEIQFLIGRCPMRSYSSWGTRHHCPMEVGAYAPLGSMKHGLVV